MSVLIIAAADDWPTDRVVVELENCGAEVFRMDTADFPQRLTLAGRIDQDAWAGDLTTEHRTVELSRIGAVYYRAPGAFRFPVGMSGPEEKFAAAQARAGLGGILAALPCRWVNHPTAMARAEFKPVQLATARDCGLSIPATLITNRPDDVPDFAAAVGGEIICKPIASPVLIEDGQLKTVYTRRLSSRHLTDLQGIDVTAHLFQAWMPKAHEVRLTVVGEQLLAAEIHAGSEEAYTDWRADYGSLTYTVTDVPEDVAAGARRYLERLGLRFAAMDFVVSPTGAWTFLEANPCGQWDWIQHATGLPIAEAIVSELQGGITA
jgi:ATP-grasp ribosomal peptide maturase